MLLNSSTLNSHDQLIDQKIYNYESIENTLGMSTESFGSIAYSKYYNVSQDQGWIAEFYVNSTSIEEISTRLTSIQTLEGSFSSNIINKKFDFLTGKVLETISENSRGNRFKTEAIPAYTIPDYNPSNGFGMGSKVDDPTNKNMLTQNAMTKTYIEDSSGNWNLIDASITTWNNNWNYFSKTGSYEPVITNPAHKIWRKHKTYIWDGSIDSEGLYTDFTGDHDNFNWGLGSYNTLSNGIKEHVVTHSVSSNWKTVSEVTTYNHYSMPLEVKDINGNFSSTKTDANHEKVFSSSNASYTEQFYSGAEEGNNGFVGGHVNIWYPVTNEAHTGIYSEHIGVGSKGFKCEPIPRFKSGQTSKKFKISVWVMKPNHENIRVSIGGQIQEFNGETNFADQWVMKNHYFDLSSSVEIFVTTSTGVAYLDDFRLHPMSSSMNSYVYNEWDELSHILGANNLGTRYEYDEAGRLIRVYNEIVDEGGRTGGFKLAKEMKYRYRSDRTVPTPSIVRNPLFRTTENGTVMACHPREIDLNGTEIQLTFKMAQGFNPNDLQYPTTWTTDLCMELELRDCATTYYKVAVRNPTTGRTREWTGNYFNAQGCPINIELPDELVPSKHKKAQLEQEKLQSIKKSGL